MRRRLRTPRRSEGWSTGPPAQARFPPPSHADAGGKAEPPESGSCLSSHLCHGRPDMGIMRRVRFRRVNTKGLCHESERVTEAESHSESQDIDSHAEQIQKYIYALVLWLLLDALADLPQFFRLHVFGRAGFWCHGGNGCRVVFQTHTRGARRGVNLVDRIALRNRRARVLTSCSHKHTGDFAAALRMDPCAFTATGEPDRPDPARFRYEITSRALTA